MIAQAASLDPHQTVNIHLGIRDVYPTLLEKSAHLFRKQLKQVDAGFITSDQFKRFIRPAIKGVSPRILQSDPIDHYSELEQLGGNNVISMSQHAALDSLNWHSSSTRLYSQLPLILDGIERFFSGANLNIHLTIICQHDYGPIVDSPNPLETTAVWSDFVQKIADAVPSAKISVWAIDDPITLSVPFVANVLGLNHAMITTRMADLIKKLAAEQRFAKPARSLDTLPINLSEYLDALYDRDLLAIAAIHGVKLFYCGGVKMIAK